MVAATGCELHLVEPMGSTCPNPLRRAGLDYHDLASVTVHPSLEAAWSAIGRPGCSRSLRRRSLLRRHRLPTR
jgi:tRNA(Leu) C34 or U34 (ribose-2'-O)-methylase TrmL